MNTATQPTLIFIPDISGFTHFVSNTEITHSRHIIEELLETLLEANEIGLEVSEIEGDAILFYRFGQAPTAAELLAQVQKMFVRFHAHLKKYETHRICHCGACRTAHDLTLKFIAHYGDIAQNRIKEYTKLFGKDVIVAHRLLKNDIEHHEYALFTDPLVKACSTWVEVPEAAWTGVQRSEQEYDSGPVKYCYLALAPLMERVPDPAPEDYRIPGVTAQVMHSEAVIDAPMKMVFDVISDLPWRSRWVVDAEPEVTDLNHAIFQEGATHKCLAKGAAIVSHDFHSRPESISFSETNVRRDFSIVYTLYRVDDRRTRAVARGFMKRNPFTQLIFRLFYRKNIMKAYAETWTNLNGYCQGLIAAGSLHHYAIETQNEEQAAA